ncbi:MAG: hypothetical protein RLZ37_598, partial [Actinomycetota bacterium]
NNVRNLLVISGVTPSGSDARLDIRKFDTQGAPVSAFGTNGVLTVDLSTNPELRVRVYRAEVDAAGAITVVGQYDRSNGAPVRFVARLTSVGAIDTTFNGTGVVEVAGATSVSAAPDGSVVVVGNTGPSYWAKRYSGAGALDANFGSGGSITASSAFIPAAFNSDGSFFLARTDAGQLKVVKYDSSGVAVQAWASGEKVLGDPAVSETALRMRVVGQSLYLLHKVQVAGQGLMDPPSATWRVAKVDLSDNNGNLSQGFGSSGVAVSPSYLGVPTELSVLSSGDILVWGYYFDNAGPTAALIRFSATGQLDPTFATDATRLFYGTCSLSFGYQNEDSIGVVEDATGKLLIAAQEFSSGMSGISATQLARLDFGVQNQNQQPQNPPSNNVFVPVTPPTTPPAEDDDDDEPRVPGRPTLVTDENRPGLVRPPGQSGLVVDGETQEVVTTRIETPGSNVQPNRRTPAQIQQIREAANNLVQNFQQQLPQGTNVPFEVVNTPTGAVIRNLVFDASGNPVDVPAEDIVLMEAEEMVLMVGANQANVTPDGRFQVPVGSSFGLAGSGFGDEEDGEFVVMSTPTLIAEFATAEDGTFEKSGTLPASIAVGDHTLVVATGSTYAVLGIQVVPTTLPVTGGDSNQVVVFALFTLVFGALLVRSRRTLLV